jgi:hypothetical protein
MSDQDDKLAKKLQALEEGEPVENLIEGDNNSDELSALVNLAATIRKLPHPELDRRAIQSEKQKLVAASKKKRANQRHQGSKVGGFTGQWLFVPAAAGLALILLMAFVLAAGAGIYIAGPRGAHTATLTEVEGILEVSDSGLAGDWHPLAVSEKVQSGQRIRTAAGSYGTIEFFEGTQTTLAPNTDLMLETIDGNWGDVLQVALIQNSGQTEHGVVPLQGDQAAYNVYTTSGTATVKGTKFMVLVDESGMSTFKVDHGQVLVTNDGSQAYVGAGQGLATALGEELSSPGYLFTLQGQWTAQFENMWTVAGVNVFVPEGLEPEGSPQLFDYVLVQGQIQDQYDWVADSVELALTEDQAGEFTGFVSYVSEDQLTWQVNGIDFTIEDEGLAANGIESGDTVQVAFAVLEGGEWQVTQIASLEGEEDAEKDDLSPDADSPPDGEEQPGEESPSCTGVDPHPKAVKLLTDYPDAAVTDGTDSTRPVSEDDIMGWFCDNRLGFGEIELALKLSKNSELLVDEIIELRLGGQGWGQIKQYLDELPADDEPAEEETPPEGEETPEDEEPEEGEDESPDDDGETCTGTAEHPKALKLESEYENDKFVEVSYDDIMTWFCDLHFGFGEIDLMLGLSSQYEVDVEEIIAMRQGGLGWGQIKKDLAEDSPAVEEFVNPAGKVPPGKNKSEENKNKPKPNKKDDD